MSDVLIRGVTEDDLRRIDAEAERRGLSRNEYLRREISRLAQRGTRAATRVELARAAELVADLADEDVMRQAWS